MRDLPAAEVYCHIREAKRRQSQDQLNRLDASAYPHMSKAKDQKKVWQRACAIGTSTFRRKSPYEVVQGVERVRMIGGELKLRSELFHRKNVAELQWLESEGWTETAAIAEYDRWVADRLADPFFDEPDVPKGKTSARRSDDGHLRKAAAESAGHQHSRS